jgi:hypothetical protein
LAVRAPDIVITGEFGPSPSRSLLCIVIIVPPPIGVNVAVKVVRTSSWFTGAGFSSSLEHAVKAKTAKNRIDRFWNVFIFVSFNLLII